jgi:DNA repair exonuclease SbcCD ATPase subunit
VINLKAHQDFLCIQNNRFHDLRENLSKIELELSKNIGYLGDIRKCGDVMNAVAALAQVETKEMIEELITKALQAVFGEDYRFELDSQVSRGKPEINMYVVKKGVRRSLKDEEGGSVAVLVATVMRVVLSAMNCRQYRNVIILDEPLKDSSKDKFEFLGEMLKQLSEMLGFQFIIVTHEAELASNGKIFTVTQDNGVSEVSQ